MASILCRPHTLSMGGWVKFPNRSDRPLGRNTVHDVTGKHSVCIRCRPSTEPPGIMGMQVYDASRAQAGMLATEEKRVVQVANGEALC